MEEALFGAPPCSIYRLEQEEAKLKQKRVKKVRDLLQLIMTQIWNKINSQNVSNHVRVVALALICSFLVYLWPNIVQKMKIGGPLQGF